MAYSKPRERTPEIETLAFILIFESHIIQIGKRPSVQSTVNPITECATLAAGTILLSTQKPVAPSYCFQK